MQTKSAQQRKQKIQMISFFIYFFKSTHCAAAADGARWQSTNVWGSSSPVAASAAAVKMASLCGSSAATLQSVFRAPEPPAVSSCLFTAEQQVNAAHMEKGGCCQSVNN